MVSAEGNNPPTFRLKAGCSANCIKFAGESSRTTHGSAECIDSCRYFADQLFFSYRVKSKTELLSVSKYQPDSSKVKTIASGDFLKKPKSELKGSGYVIESMEAALWCFFNTESFEDAVLSAANLGDDADTTAAICGQIAGGFYGLSGIPEAWREKLYMRKEIEELGDELYTASRG